MSSEPGSNAARHPAGARHAVILAGGKGARLRPFTVTLPKPLMPIGDEFAIIEVVLRQLARRGFASATLAIGHLGALIQAYVGDGRQWGIAVDYAIEHEPLGTMGPVVRLLGRLPEHFIVMNGDVLTDIDYADLLATHIASRAPITVATYPRELAVDFGVIEVDDRTIVAFQEKPTLPYRVSMGVYAVAAEALGHVTPGQAYGFDDLMRDLLAQGRNPASYPFDGFWLDIGRPDDYERANREFSELRTLFLPEG